MFVIHLEVYGVDSNVVMLYLRSRVETKENMNSFPNQQHITPQSQARRAFLNACRVVATLDGLK